MAICQITTPFYNVSYSLHIFEPYDLITELTYSFIDCSVNKRKRVSLIGMTPFSFNFFCLSFFRTLNFFCFSYLYLIWNKTTSCEFLLLTSIHIFGSQTLQDLQLASLQSILPVDIIGWCIGSIFLRYQYDSSTFQKLDDSY